MSIVEPILLILALFSDSSSNLK